MRRGIAVGIVLVAAAVGLLATSCGDVGPGPDQARLELDGTAVVTTADGARASVTDGRTLTFGDTVAMEEGTAVLELADGAVYELRARGDVGTELEVGAPPRLTAGDLLVRDGFPAQVRVDAATLTAHGALRVDAEETVATAYAGRASVAGTGDVDSLPGLRRLVLVAGASPEPLTFDGTDPWDRRYLGEAVAFGDQLEALARGYTSDLPPDGGRTEGFFQSVVPALGDEREFNADLLDPERPPGETLVGAAIAVQGQEGTFRERWEAVFAFRDAGAEWGLVALDQGVSSAPVLETIELAIGTTTTTAASPTAPGSGPSTSSTTSPGAPGPTDPAATTTTTTTTPPPEPAPDPLDPVTGPAEDLLDNLLDVLLLLQPG